MRISGTMNRALASSKFSFRTHLTYSGANLIYQPGGFAPPAPRYTVTRSRLRPLAPFPWLASLRSLAAVLVLAERLRP
jgi:hypothetical protein